MRSGATNTDRVSDSYARGNRASAVSRFDSFMVNPQYRIRPLYLDPVLLPSNGQAPAGDGAPFIRPGRTEVKRTLFELLNILARGKWLALVVFILVNTLIILYTFNKEPEYSAYTLLMVGGQDVTAGAALGAGYANPGIDLQSQALMLQNSLLIPDRTADRLLAMRRLPLSGSPIEILQFEGQPLSRRAISRRIRDYTVSIRPDGPQAIRIESITSSAEEAALIANIYSEEYVQLSQTTRSQRLTASRRFLEEQIGKRKAELLGIEESISRVASLEDADNPAPGSRGTLDQVFELRRSLSNERTELAIKESQLKARETDLAEARKQVSAQVTSGTSEEIERTQKRITEIEGILEPIYLRAPGLREDPGNNVELQDLQRQYAQLKTRLDGLYARRERESFEGSLSKEEASSRLQQISNSVTELQRDIDNSRMRVLMLERNLNDYQLQLHTTPAHSVQLSQLERSRESAEALYVSLVNKLQEVRMAEEAETGFIHIVRPALIPDAPVRPNKAKNVAAGIMLGLVLGMAAAVARHWLDSRIYTPDHLHERELPVIGVIPDLRVYAGRGNGWRKHHKKTGYSLPALLNPHSTASESYRSLLVSLQKPVPDRLMRTVLVTSPEAKTGKSTTALNLAVTAARSGRRTLIVDADLRRPSLEQYIQTSPRIGLVDLLNNPRRMWHVDDLATDVDNLFYLPAWSKGGALNASFLENDQAMFRPSELQYMVADLCRQFDLVLFDSTPVLVSTDTILLAITCDATIMVISSGRTDGEALEHAFQELHGAGANVAGVILNRFNPLRRYGDAYKYRYNLYESYYRAD